MAHLRRYLSRSLAPVFFAITACLVACVSSVRAESSEDQGPSFELVALADFTGRDQLYYLGSATEAELVTIPVVRRSAPIKPKSISAPLVFGTKQTDPKTGLTTYQPVVQVAWPAGGPDRALVFFAPDANGRPGVVAVDDSLKTFPGHSLRVINFSGVKLLGKFGAFEGAIPPGPQAAVAYPQVDTPDGSVGRFHVGIARNDDAGNAKVIFNGWTEAWSGARTILLIKQEGGRIQIRTMVQNLPAAPTAKSATP